MAQQNPFVTQAPNTMALVAPDLAAQQMRLARQQQMADYLRQQSLTPMGDTQYISGSGPTIAVKRSPMEGMAKLLGAYLAKNQQDDIDQQQLSLNQGYAQRMAQLLGGGAPSGSPAPSQDNVSTALGQGAQAGSIGPTNDNAALLDALNSQPAPQPPAQQAPQSQFGMANLLRGQVIGQMGGEPAAAAYWKQYEPTDFTKLLISSGIDPASPLGKQIMQQQIAKQNNIPLQAGRPGAPMYDAQGNIVAMAPKIPDNAVPQIVNGRVAGVSPLPGSAGVEQMNAYAGAAGKNQAEPITAYNGAQPVFTNKLDAALGGGAGNAGSGLDLSKLTPQQIQVLQRQDPTAFANGVASFASSQNSAQQLTPGMEAGKGAFLDKQAAAAGDRVNATRSFAADSPMRVNVLDNLLNLSQQGVQTGPTADWTNKFKGVVASLPGADSVPGVKNFKGEVSDYQEFKKFAMQNAQRAWQAAGGTGTDAQLEASIDSNLNAKLFPQAVQTIAKWAKAGELAAQSKANAQDSWLSSRGNTPASQGQFESAWRNNLDPRLYQLRVMAPAEAQDYVNNLKQRDPQGYNTLMQKAQQLKQLGGL